MNYYPFHLGDYASHTAHLEPIEDLAYRRMLDLYYMSELPLPVDAADVARRIRLRQSMGEVQAVLSEFFTLCADGWRHVRCDEELERMKDKQAKARASAAASVCARKAKAEAENLSNECTAANQRTVNGRSAEVELPTPTPTPTSKLRLEVESDSPHRGSRLPSDWQLPEAWAIWAMQTRPDLDPHETANRFADYWHSIPGAKGRKVDWLATWRNWVRNEKVPLRAGVATMHSKVARQVADQNWVDVLMDRNSADVIDLVEAIQVGKSV
jgi:uncharacterized protein YdaU (DUF1376 family)